MASRLRRAPERPSGINPVWIELEHLVVEFLRARRRLNEAVEVADVLSGLFDDPRTVVALGSLVCSDNCARVEGLDLVECGKPLLSLLPG